MSTYNCKQSRGGRHAPSPLRYAAYGVSEIGFSNNGRGSCSGKAARQTRHSLRLRKRQLRRLLSQRSIPRETE